MLLPAAFIRSNSEDPAWLCALAELVQTLAERWSLRLERPFASIKINYVAPATRQDGTRCVLKISRHVRETRSEIAALRIWNGVAAPHLLEAAPELGALLLEYISPGTDLVEVASTGDDEATRIAANLLRQLWRPLPAHHGLRPLKSWCEAYTRNRAAILAGDTGFPVALFRRADGLRRDLLASTRSPVVLHGDLHHFNILRARRTDWLAIDPKGLAGDRSFDVCQFFRNPRPMPPSVNSRRLDILCSELDLDRDRARAWCFVHAVLDACWEFEDGKSWQAAVAYAETTLSF